VGNYNRAYAEVEEKFDDKCLGSTTVEQGLRCLRDAIASAREPQRSEEDVQAQKQMATAAWAMFWSTVVFGSISVFLTAVGIHYISRTFIETRRQIEVSQRALLTAVTANDNAIKTFEQDGTNSERQLRAYVYIDKFTAKPIGPDENDIVTHYEIGVILKNFGQTPAKKCITHLECCISGADNIIDIVNAESIVSNVTQSDIGPSGEIWSAIDVSAFHLRAAELGGIFIFIFGWIEYYDVFQLSQRRRTEFSYKVTSMGDANREGATIKHTYYGPMNGSDESCYRKPQTI
jgi:hypothetical protein